MKFSILAMTTKRGKGNAYTDFVKKELDRRNIDMGKIMDEIGDAWDDYEKEHPDAEFEDFVDKEMEKRRLDIGDVMKEIGKAWQEKKKKDKKAAQDPAREYLKIKREIEQQIRRIEKTLLVHEKKFLADPRNWGYVGDLGHVREQLKEIANFEGAGY